MFARGDFAGAAAAFSESLAIRPGDVAALANRAAARLKLRDYGAAASDASRCLDHDPDHAKARHRRALARRATGDFRGALEDLERLAELLPNHAGVARELEEARGGFIKATRTTRAERGGPSLERGSAGSGSGSEDAGDDASDDETEKAAATRSRASLSLIHI